MTDKINIVIVGCGKITRVRHAPECHADGRINLCGFFDKDKQRAEAMAEKFGGAVYESFEEVINDDKINAVIICVINSLHAPMTIAALNAGKHVVCEKPIATAYDEAADMIRAAEKNNRILMIAHNQRLCKISKKAKEIIDAGDIGDILSFRAVFSHNGPDNRSADAGSGTWFLNKNAAGLGVIGDLGIHKADLLHGLTGADITHVTANLSTLHKTYSDGSKIAIDDNALCIAEMSNGAKGTIEVSWTNYGKDENYTNIYGTKGSLYIDMVAETVTVNSGGTQLVIPVKNTGSGVAASFAESVISGNPPESDGMTGLKALSVVLAAIKSSETGTRTTVISPLGKQE